jgi:hypothetical protein
VVTSPEEKAFVRSQIAFYASTPSYRPVMALHGWEETADQLSSLAARGMWNEMPDLINDNMLAVFAVIAHTGELSAALLERYQNLADRITLYLPFVPGKSDDFWRTLLSEM